MEKNYKNFSRGRRLDWQFYKSFVTAHKIPRREVIIYVVELLGKQYRCEEFSDRYMAERFLYNQLALAMRGKLGGVSKIELWHEISTGNGILDKKVEIIGKGRAIETILRWGYVDCSAYDIRVKEPTGEDDPF